MINIITVHWQDDRWIDIQLKYFKNHIRQPYRVWAFLNHLETDHSSKFFYSSTEMIKSHAIKLNMMAEMVINNGYEENDLLLFIDGDAFPIADIDEFLSDKLSEYPLVAVKREENLMDLQPHPLFCATTCKFWKEIKGDWRKGYSWMNAERKLITDVGGNLLGQLNKFQIDWYPILRTGKISKHPLFFALYGDLIYHHGAGFRLPLTRLDYSKISKKRRFLAVTVNQLKKVTVLNPIINSLRRNRWTHLRNEVANQNKLASDTFFEKILENENFYMELRN